MKHFLLSIALLLVSFLSYAQTDETQIKSTLLNYINGTSYNHAELIEKAFYPDANLYLEKKDEELWIVPIKEYTSWYKDKTPGTANGRVGNIIAIDYFNSIATAKAEILIPEADLRFVDLFLLKRIENEWKIISKTASKETSNMSGDKILFIVSNAAYHGDSDLPTGNSFSEIINAYSTFKKAGYTVDFVSPKGGSIPLAYINTSDSLHKKHLYNSDFMYALKHTKNPNEIIAKDYKAVHYIGGGSAMFGVPENKEIQKISMSIYEEYNGIISAVCHGTAGITNLKTKNGRYLIENKTVNGVPDSFENDEAEYYKYMPFLIQKTLEERGAIFKFSNSNIAHIEVDGNIITGQNYLSSEGVALKIIENLNARKKAK